MFINIHLYLYTFQIRNDDSEEEGKLKTLLSYELLRERDTLQQQNFLLEDIKNIYEFEKIGENVYTVLDYIMYLAYMTHK